MALMVTSPNQYVLGGISAPSTNISSAFQAGQQSNLNRQTTRQQMQERDQMMKLRELQEQRAKAQEARTQQAFEAQQAARAQAAARAAQERAAMSTLMEGLSGVGGTPTGGVSGAAPVAPVAAPRAGLALPTGPRVPLSFPSSVTGAAPTQTAPAAGTPLSMDMTPTGPAGGVQVASLDPMESFRAAFQARPDLFGGGVQVADASGVGTPIRTGQVTAAGRPVFQDPATGELYSERTETFQAPNGAFYNVPMVNAAGGQISPEELNAILSSPRPVDPVTGEPLTPYNSVEQAVSAASARSDGLLPTGQPVRTEYGGIQFDVYPDGRIINMVTNTEIPATGEYDALRTMLTEQAGVGVAPQADVTTPGFTEVDPQASALVQDVQGMLRQGDIAGALSRIQVGLATGTYGPMGSPLGRAIGYAFDSPEEAARRTAVREATQWFNDPENEQFLRANPNLIAEAAADPIGFVARQSGAAVTPSERATQATGVEPPSPEAAAAETPTTAEEAAPTVETPWGGLQLDFGTRVQLSFGEFDGRGSEAYVAAPERIFQDAELVGRQQQRLQLLANYYQQTNNLQGLVGVMNQLDALSIEQRYLDGMVAIVGIQRENFGPVQALLQQRYPGQQVEVRPYTDGTLEIYVDGERVIVEGTGEYRPTWGEFVTDLQSIYDKGFIEQQQAVAAEAASRSRYLFEKETEQMLQGAREIAVANNQAEIGRLEASGQITRIGETGSGEVIFQTVVRGVPIQFVYRETTVRDPRTGEEIPALVATPVSRAALER